ncbi:DEAD/DEAH box helicase [Nocardia salmonicida]|uniref:DEAD/DEAH box helicase n=1 Tax=Nocardia salmonicida TaxID=53431 RepID=UPI0036A61FE1
MGGNDRAARLVQFWRTVEMFSPQTVPDPTPPRRRDADIRVVDLAPDQPAPWEDDSPIRLPAAGPGKVWQYSLYGGLFDLDRTRDVLVRSFGADPVDDDGRKSGTTAVFAFTITHDGAIVENSPTLSALAWAVSRLHNPGPRNPQWLDGFDREEREFVTALNTLAPPKPNGTDARTPQHGPRSTRIRHAATDAVSKGAGAAATVAVTAAATALAGPVAGGIAGTVAGTFAEKLLARDTAPGTSPTEPGSLRTRSLTTKDLCAFSAELAAALGISGALAPTGLRVKCFRVRAGSSDEVGSQEFLNSFIATDLGEIETAVRKGDLGPALRDYLTDTADIPVGRRIDVRRDTRAVLAGVEPKRFPPGRWPGSTERPLVTSQQFAVNETMSQLSSSAGIFAVNGPPGTGKTTMLRDILAAIVVARATRLADLTDPSAAFGAAAGAVQVTKNYTATVHRLIPALTGFEIVLATASNDAATNVTAEIPGVAAIAGAETDALETNYFADLATSVLDQPAWGLVAAALGNMGKRRQFGERFWFDGGDRSPATSGMLSMLKLAESDPSTVPDWRTAVTEYTEQLREVDSLADRRQAIADAIAEIPTLRTDIDGAMSAVHAARQAHTEAREQNRVAADAMAREQQRSGDISARIAEHAGLRPGFWVSLSTWFRAGREWHADGAELVRERQIITDTIRQLQAELTRTATLWADATERGNAMVDRHRALSERLTDRLQRIHESIDSRPGTVPYGEVLDSDTALQLCTVWADEQFSRARHRLFLSALALHRAFLLNAAKKARANLAVAVAVVRNEIDGRPSAEAIEAAWQTLFLVVPMVSTTFASLPRLFSGLQRESLGWLFIDEAGQATPQSAVGGLWRAQRAVIVGDPRQLEPVVTLPRTAQTAILDHYGLDREWLPDNTSAQQVADRLARFGTALEAAGDGDPVWVGAPLRVHRRCDRPMFEIANRIAYGGDLMVYGTPERPEFPGASVWLDAKAEHSEGKWIPREGEVLARLLRQLVDDGVPLAQIRVVSPFREVVSGAKREAKRCLGAEFSSRNVGTVHTVQGQEADVVILVLGTAPSAAGARAWAGATPNLLNVAVSRAKRRFYVIGDHRLWRTQRHFDVLAAGWQVRH